MPTSANQKMKLLYLIKIFSELTDENHSLSMAQLINELAKFAVQAERKSIYSDIEYLQNYGYDIIRKQNKGSSYYLGSRDFQLAELKLLVDAVQSSQFITKKKSEELITKLSQLASKHQAKELNRQILGINKAKTLNEHIYYNINELHNAINNGRKIKFRYFDTDETALKNFRKAGEFYLETPLTLYWNDDRYYAVCYSSKHKNLLNYRVDRMDSVNMSEEAADYSEKRRLNINNYISSQFGMYSGDVVKATVRFDKSLLNPVIDRFGTNLVIKPDGDYRQIIVDVTVSPVFFAWVFQFGNKIEVLAPKSLRKALQNQLSQVRALY